MSTHEIPKTYPKNIKHTQFCRNGQVPSGSFARKVAYGIDHIVAYRRKNLGFYMRNVRSIPAGASGTNSLWHFYCKTGHGAKRIEAVILYASPTATGTDPYISMDVTPSGSGTIASNELHMSAQGATDIPDNFGHGTLKVNVSGDTVHTIVVKAHDYARPVSVQLYEVGVHPVDTSNGGTVDPRINVGTRILDSTMGDLHAAQTDLIESNRVHFLSWTRDTAASAPSVTGTTYTNLMDGSSTGNAADTTPGFRVDLTYLADYGQTVVPVTFAVLGEVTTTGSAGHCKLVDSSGTALAELSTVDNNTWATTTANITVGSLKFDIQGKANGGGETCRFDAVSCYVDG